MKHFAAILSLHLCIDSTHGFTNTAPRAITSSLEAVKHIARNQLRDTTSHHRKIDEIAHELEELGAEIKLQLRNNEPHGFGDDFHESLVHKLRRKIHEHDVHYQHELKEMRALIQELSTRLELDAVYQQDLKDRVKQLENKLTKSEETLLWTEVDLELEREKRLRYVLWHVFKVTNTKVNNAVGKAVDSMLKFLHLYKDYKDEEI